MKDCLVIMTGGTIDAEPYKKTPRNVKLLEHSIVPDAVEELGLAKNCRFLQWLMKDSKDFKKSDAEQLAEFIEARRARHIVVTHGTDRMPQHSRRLEKLLEGTDKTVIVTGSMTPLTHGKRSDAYRNLRVAIEDGADWTAGVHVVMHGKHFHPKGLWKDPDAKRFHQSR